MITDVTTIVQAIFNQHMVPRIINTQLHISFLFHLHCVASRRNLNIFLRLRLIGFRVSFFLSLSVLIRCNTPLTTRLCFLFCVADKHQYLIRE